MTRTAALACSLPLLLAAGCVNFHAVEEGRMYRSAQPDEEQLSRWIEEYDIKTVLRLRGSGRTRGLSYRPTVGADIAFVQVPLSATRLPPKERLLELWQVFETAEYPMLVHCRAGADRTGLVSSLYVLHRTGDLDRARAQLALIPYLHTGLLGSGAMDRVLDMYAPYQDRMSFPDWVREVYEPSSQR